jgi:AbrB family transcriptional regulator, transcriptional pleiotropic regulator of transition state genes
MKDTGIVRQIDDLGRIVIPIEIRKRFKIEKRDQLEIWVKGDRILIGKPREGCTFCGRLQGLREHYGQLVCASCREELSGAEAARDSDVA